MTTPKDNWIAAGKFREKMFYSWSLSLANYCRIRASVSGRREKFFLKHLKRGPSRQKILDVGCGAGRYCFCHHGQVYGLDIDEDMVRMARQLYWKVDIGNAANMPYEDGFFDVVMSSDLLGHIPLADKTRVWTEMARVLKLGGLSLHCIETESDNWWFKWALKTGRYREYLVDKPGHIGLETPLQVLNRFRRINLQLIEVKRTGSNIPCCGELSGAFGKANGWMGSLIRLDNILAKFNGIRELVNVGLVPLFWLDEWFSPINRAHGILTAHLK